MGLLDSLKRTLGLQSTGDKPRSNNSSGARPEGAAEEEIRVPEVTAVEVLAERQAANHSDLLLLDCREHYERAQAYIPGSVHIPMNTIPSRLAELDRDREILVYCAHGNRSYGVAGWLIQQGYRALSLKGGIVDWQLRNGPVESPPRGRR